MTCMGSGRSIRKSCSSHVPCSTPPVTKEASGNLLFRADLLILLSCSVFWHRLTLFRLIVFFPISSRNGNDGITIGEVLDKRALGSAAEHANGADIDADTTPAAETITRSLSRSVMTRAAAILPVFSVKRAVSTPLPPRLCLGYSLISVRLP